LLRHRRAGFYYIYEAPSKKKSPSELFDDIQRPTVMKKPCANRKFDRDDVLGEDRSGEKRDIQKAPLGHVSRLSVGIINSSLCIGKVGFAYIGTMVVASKS